MDCEHIPQIIEYDSFNGNYKHMKMLYMQRIRLPLKTTISFGMENQFIKKSILCLKINPEHFGILFQVVSLKKVAFQILEDMKE